MKKIAEKVFLYLSISLLAVSVVMAIICDARNPFCVPVIMTLVFLGLLSNTASEHFGDESSGSSMTFTLICAMLAVVAWTDVLVKLYG